MPQQKIYKYNGFTLIEISIVIVVVAFIIGGIFVGRDLIEQANIRAQLSQVEQIETEINTFRTKYNCLPGDCANATDFFGSTSGILTIANGDGNTIIKSDTAYIGGAPTSYGSGECLNPDAIGEVSQLFLHLYLAGIGNYGDGKTNSVALSGTSYPYAKYGNKTGVFVTCLAKTGTPNYTISPFRTGNIITIGVSGNPQNTLSRIGYRTGQFNVISYSSYGLPNGLSALPIGIPVNAARQMDDKLDDGKPSTGRLAIIAGESVACDNAALSSSNSTLLSAYPAPSVACNVTIGKKIN